MTFRILAATLAATILSACSNDVTGQKGGKTPLKTPLDSVSYGIGTQVGENLKANFVRSGMDSLNNAALAAGLRDALDSTMIMSSEKVNTMVQAYMIEMQKKVMAAEQVKGEANIKAGEAFLAENGKRPGVITTSTGLQYEILQQGEGPKPLLTDEIKAHYKGTTIDGVEFESSYKRGQPTQLPVQQWIPGFMEIFQIMPVGSRYKVYVPSNLAYGAQSPGPEIPPYSTLLFELELVEIVKK
ncbi:MAG: FKBP-type peptidyl-prolyl cis-trans isomerase N-terminal domain-containing protein [Flavobacteriales bacterium]